MKGLILSGGKGTRLRPITHTSAKQLVPVANKPVLFYGIEAMVAAGIADVGIIIAPETGDEIRTAVGDGSQFGAAITYVEQDEPLGLAHASLTAEAFLEASVRHVPRRQIPAGRHHRPRRVLRANSPRADPAHPSRRPAELRRRGARGDRVVRLVEKPAEPATDLASSASTCSRPASHEARGRSSPATSGELEITTHPVSRRRRPRVEPHIVRGWWKDTGA